MARAALDSSEAVAPVTHGRVLRLAGPVVLSNATVPILGLVDSGVVGQIEEAAPLAAVGVGAMILTTLYWFFGFLRMGTVGFAAQAMGRGDHEEASAILSRALLIAGVAGAFIILAQMALFWLAFRVGPVEAEVEEMARSYMAIRVFSAPAIIGIYAVTGWLVAAERTGAMLVVQLWMNGLNIVLDLWFVLGLGWGVEGVAIATFIAEWSGLALGLWFCRGAFAGTAWRDWARIADPASLRRFAAVNRDIFIRSALLQAIFLSFLLSFSPRFGTVELAANQILLQFLYVTAYAMDGYAFAVETLVGRALGARSRAALRRAATVCLIWSMVTGLVLAVIFGVFGPWIIDLMTKAEPVQAAARVYLVYMVLAPFLGGPSWLLDGIFIGATRSRDMRDMMILSAVIYFAAAFALMPLLENHGLWVAFLISFVARGITLGSRYPALERSASEAAVT